MKLLIIAALVFSSSSIYAIRCGGNVVTEGDSEYSVASSCGQPDYVNTTNDDWGSTTTQVYKSLNDETLTTTVTIQNGKVIDIKAGK